MTEGMKIFEGDRQFFALKTLNSFSPRPFFFIVLVKREEFTNLFLGLLDSPGKNAKVS
jgi:hypothetical protein